MVDTARARADIITLFADNVTGSISAQDARDFIVTVMPSDFQFSGDAWAQPLVAFTTTDKTGRGWIEYSHTAGSALSFGNAVCFDASTSLLHRAYCSVSARMPIVGVVLDSYASDAANVQLLRKGILVNSYHSGTYSGNAGRPVYLCFSGTSAGEYSVTFSQAADVSFPPIVGIVCASTAPFAGADKLFVNPMWWIAGGN